MEKAKADREKLLEEGLAHKRSIVAEATELAKQEQDKILEKANREAQLIIEKANREADTQKRDFESQFEQGVKQSALVMVKKLFASNPKAADTYVSGLVDEFTNSYKD